MLDFKQAPRFKLAPLLQLEIKNNYPTSTKPPPLPLNLPQEKKTRFDIQYNVQYMPYTVLLMNVTFIIVKNYCSLKLYGFAFDFLDRCIHVSM